MSRIGHKCVCNCGKCYECRKLKHEEESFLLYRYEHYMAGRQEPFPLTREEKISYARLLVESGQIER